MIKAIYLILCTFILTSPVFSEETYLFEGTHLIANYSECDPEALKDLDTLKATLLLAIEKSNSTILKYADYIFEPDGLTMVVLLSESHASIHTYPEHAACFIDLFTCGEKCRPEEFAKTLEEYLKPQKISKQLLIRNESLSEK